MDNFYATLLSSYC